jgi:sec-independent protein translocase protein TatA
MLEGLFQPMHLLLILFIVLIIFGPGKLPQIGAGLGKSIREFKKALSDADKPHIDAGTGEEKNAEKTAEDNKRLY